MVEETHALEGGPDAAPAPAEPFTYHELPNGLEVRFEKGPHKYALKTSSSVETHEPEWLEVVGVTDVLKVLDKPGLPWWGMTLGVEGVLTLFNTGAIFPVNLPGRDRPLIACPALDGSGANVIAGVEELVAWMEKFKLTTNQVKKRAGDRGQAAHDAFELWLTEGLVPEPSIYPAEERGYIEGLLKFMEAVPLKPVASELVVASAELECAGRFDCRAILEEDVYVVQRIVDKSRNLKWGTLEAGESIYDLKTSKYVYESHGKQLEAYELLSIDSGWKPTDGRYVIHVTADGLYEVVPSLAGPEDFLSTLEEYRSSRRIAARRTEFGKGLKK